MTAIPVQPAHAQSRGASVPIADAPREPLRSCIDHAYDVYLTSGWWEAVTAYLNCDGNPNHPDNDEKP